jgi:glycosyltransferase involved in cell wall biosynthesis
MKVPNPAWPRISVIIPTYNNGRYLPQAIQSIHDQQYPDVEIIVVDDGSTDDTPEILAHYGRTIHTIRQPNAGSAAARNTGLQHATGPYIVLLDADDWLLPGKFHKQAAILQVNPRLGAIHSGWRIVNEQGDTMRDIEPWHNAPKLNLATWLQWKPVKMGAMLYRKEWLLHVGGLDPTLRQSQDVDLMLRLVYEGCVIEWLRELTLCYRQHNASTIRSQAIRHPQYALQVLDKFFAQPHLPTAIRQQEERTRYYLLIWESWHLFRSGFGTEAVPYLHQSIPLSPHNRRYTLFDWLRHFVQWSVDDGRSPADIRTMWPTFQAAAHLPPTEWEQIAPLLDWYLDIWWLYLQGDYGRAQIALAAAAPIPAADLAALAQFALIVTPIPATAVMLTQFWQDALADGRIPHRHRHTITALYLTAAGQTLLQKNGRQTAVLLSHAIRTGWMPTAWPIWLPFLQAGLTYLIGPRAQTDKNLIPQARK